MRCEIVLRVAVGILLATGSGACVTVRGDLEGSTGRRFREVAQNLDTLQSELPPSLTPFCSTGVCRENNGSDAFLDAWGREIEYDRLSGSYQLRSRGSDGIWQTPDDMVFSPELDRRWRAAFIGCYRLHDERLPAMIQLDTTERADYVYGAAPDADWQYASWWPLSETAAALIRFDSYHNPTMLRLHLTNQDLGIVRLSPPQGSFRGERIPCMSISAGADTR